MYQLYQAECNTSDPPKNCKLRLNTLPDVVDELSSALGEIEVRVGEVTEGVWAVAEVSVGMTVVAVMVRGGKVLTVKMVPEGKAAFVGVRGGKVAETPAFQGNKIRPNTITQC